MTIFWFSMTISFTVMMVVLRWFLKRDLRREETREALRIEASIRRPQEDRELQRIIKAEGWDKLPGGVLVADLDKLPMPYVEPPKDYRCDRCGTKEVAYIGSGSMLCKSCLVPPDKTIRSAYCTTCKRVVTENDECNICYREGEQRHFEREIQRQTMHIENQFLATFGVPKPLHVVRISRGDWWI